MIRLLKRLATVLPSGTQQSLKRRWFAWKIRTKGFVSHESEYARLAEYVRPGDWTLDIGANVGYYSAKMSDLVGPKGRVIAFEPIADSFELLAANSRLFPNSNLSLFNVAVSDQTNIVHMVIPKWSTGGRNFYQASITSASDGLPVLAISIDSLDLPQRVALAKIDTEGHELTVLLGMRHLIDRDHPVLIVEANSSDVVTFVKSLGYSVEQRPGSSNYVCLYDSELKSSSR